MAQYPGSGGGDPLTGGDGSGGQLTDFQQQLMARLEQAQRGANQPQQQQSLFSNQFSGQQVYLGTSRRRIDVDRPSYEGVGGLFGSPTGGAPVAPPSAYGYVEEDRTMTYDRAILAPLNWSDDRIRQFVNQGILSKAPGFSPDMGMPEIQTAWQALIETSMLYNSQLREGDQKWTPEDVLDTYNNTEREFGEQREGDWVYDIATGERLRYVGPRSKTVTSERVDLSSPEDVNALVLQSLRELLGRAPTERELTQFRSSINNLERERPQIATTTQTLSPDLETGEVSVTEEETTVEGGVSETARAMLVQEDVVGTQEYGKYQAATTYWDAMMGMIGGA